MQIIHIPEPSLRRINMCVYVCVSLLLLFVFVCYQTAKILGKINVDKNICNLNSRYLHSFTKNLIEGQTLLMDTFHVIRATTTVNISAFISICLLHLTNWDLC